MTDTEDDRDRAKPRRDSGVVSSTDGDGYPFARGGYGTGGSPGPQTDSHSEPDAPSAGPGYQGDSERRRSVATTQDEGSPKVSRGDESAAELDLAGVMGRAESRRRQQEQRRVPGTWMPGPEDLDRDREPGDDTGFGVDGPTREYASRQLGVRLRPEQFERLLEAARLYGVRPTTLARMMIVRGTKAIQEAETRARARELRENVDG